MQMREDVTVIPRTHHVVISLPKKAGALGHAHACPNGERGGPAARSNARAVLDTVGWRERAGTAFRAAKWVGRDAAMLPHSVTMPSHATV